MQSFPPCTHSSVYLPLFLSPFLLVPLCLIPSSCVCLLLFPFIFNPLCPFIPLSSSLFLSKKKKNTPRPQVEGVFYPYSVFHLVLHCSGENADTKRQYLDSSSGRQGSSVASLHELASEAVMCKPETSQGQNRGRRFLPYPVMTDREIVQSLRGSYHFRCSNWAGRESQDGRLP